MPAHRLRRFFRTRIQILSVGITLFAIPSCAVANEILKTGQMEIGGRVMQCKNTKIVLDEKSPAAGYARQGLIGFNLRLLKKYPPVVQQFIFMHECGHQTKEVGANEIKADCWGIRKGMEQGWIRRKQLFKICDSFYNTLGTLRHLPGPTRCRSMIFCYHKTLADWKKQGEGGLAEGDAEREKTK